MKQKFQIKNPIGNFAQISLQKISNKRKMSHLNNRFNQMHSLHPPSHSLNKKRVSLITGKQMPHLPITKRSKRYRRFQMSVYNFLERPSGAYAISYQLVMYGSLYFLLPNRFLQNWLKQKY